MNKQQLIVRQLNGLSDYMTTWHAMQAFTDTRTETTPDELWLLQHPAVFTQGQAGKEEHLLATGEIPVVQVDRGGQVTYHGPGQIVGYTLIDTKRLNIGVRELVTNIEQSIIKLLARYDITAIARSDAPGVYIDGGRNHGAKIAQLGLRVRNGCTFHGLSLNVNMNLEPFQRINPCGHAGMPVTNMDDNVDKSLSLMAVYDHLTEAFCKELDYTQVETKNTTIEALSEQL